MQAHGLIIGKFYPPHAGHHLLIRTAAATCARVSVVAMAASHESIPLAERVRWLREVHADSPNVHVTGIIDDVPVDLDSPLVWSQHVQLMRDALAAIAAPPVTAVFTSEAYGGELARRFDAQAVTLDIARSLVPISATRVREDVAAHWEYLAPPVRAGLALRVVVLGAESTGTTTLARALCERLRARGGAFGDTRWVPEYGRAYSVEKYASAVARAQMLQQPVPGFGQLQWHGDEFLHIAATQLRQQREQAALGGPVLVCDTDAFATGVWHERYLGGRHEATEQLAAGEPGHLYLLTHDADVPFHQDGVRDGEHIRRWMTGRFVERLEQAGWPYVILRGTHEQRLATSLAQVDGLLQRAWRFAPPL